MGLPARCHARSLQAGSTDNAYIEAFNGRFRVECLNAHWFLGLADAREKMEDWRRYYNEERCGSQPAIVSKPKNLTSGDPKMGLGALKPGLSSSVDEARDSAHLGRRMRCLRSPSLTTSSTANTSPHIRTVSACRTSECTITRMRPSDFRVFAHRLSK